MNSGNQLPNLEKIFRDDDKQDFSQSGGSNLAAIFGAQIKVPDAHSAKQQNQKKSGATRNPTQTVIVNKPEVIIAKVVHAFKLKNGSYVAVGKLGMALTGNISSRTYQIILYKTKQEHVSVVTLMHNFLYTVQANNYSSYYDSNKDNWSILFENSEVCIEFAREIGLARYFSKDGNLDNILYQDLTPVNKNGVAKEGDKICVKYFIATEITQPFKSNSVGLQTMTVEISRDENWERILLGTDKGLRRVLILPSTKQISLGPGFPKEKDVLLEIEIIDVQAPEEIPPPPKASGKASIISRMAKMGQPILLPQTSTTVTTDSENTDDDVPYKSPRRKTVESLEELSQKQNSRQDSTEDEPRTTHKVLKSKSDTAAPNVALPRPLVPASAFTPQWSPTQLQSNFVTLDGQMYSLQQQTITPTMPTMPAMIDPSLNVLLSETRTTNAELRMGMSKIADNVQKLLDKFHVLETQNAVTSTSERTTQDATLRLLMHMSAARTNESQASPNSNTVNNHLPINEYLLMKSYEELKKSEERISTLETMLVDNFKVFGRAKENLMSLEKRNNEKRKNLKICKVLAECCVTGQSPSASVERDSDSKKKEIKHIMNQTYQTLLSKFVDESYTTDFIKSTIANTIKNITLHVLNESNEKSETDGPESTETDIKHRDDSPSSSSVNESQIESRESLLTNITSTIQDEPPPIPPNDTDVDNDWLE